MRNTNVIGKLAGWLLVLPILVGMSTWASDGALLTKQDLKSLIANGKTAQDHERIAQHFDAKAEQLEAESKEHAALAAEYKARPTAHEAKHPMSPQTAGHCQYFAESLHKASLQARQMATDHRAMAKAVK
jgi:hypothetical protein